MLTRWERTIRLQNGLVTVTDEIDADHDVTVTYPLHALSKPMADGNDVTVARNGVLLRISPQNGDLTLREITDRFGLTESRVHAILRRSRAKLRKFLESEGIRL
jgi:hypothetical protein